MHGVIVSPRAFDRAHLSRRRRVCVDAVRDGGGLRWLPFNWRAQLASRVCSQCVGTTRQNLTCICAAGVAVGPPVLACLGGASAWMGATSHAGGRATHTHPPSTVWCVKGRKSGRGGLWRAEAGKAGKGRGQEIGRGQLAKQKARWAGLRRGAGGASCSKLASTSCDGWSSNCIGHT